jgi:hypothetical protein
MIPPGSPVAKNGMNLPARLREEWRLSTDWTAAMIATGTAKQKQKGRALGGIIRKKWQISPP